MRGTRHGDRLFRYAEGGLSQREASELEAEAEESDTLRAQLQQAAELRSVLLEPAPGLREVDLSGAVLASLNEEPRASHRAQRKRRTRLAALWATPVVAAAALCSLYFLRDDSVRGGSSAQPAAVASEFRSKSASPSPESDDQWAGISAYRFGLRGGSELLDAELAASAELGFTYTNLGPRPYSHLMIFALDAGGAVHWFYPAADGPDPEQSIPISTGDAAVELPDAVAHAYAPGRLQVRAVFSRRALATDDVEELAREGAWSEAGWSGERLPIDDTAQQILSTEVVGGAP